MSRLLVPSPKKGWELLSTATPSGAASVLFDLLAHPDHSHFSIRGKNIVSSTTSDRIQVRTSSDGGSTFDSGSNNYSGHRREVTGTTPTPADVRISATALVMTSASVHSAGQTYGGMDIWFPADNLESLMEWVWHGWDGSFPYSSNGRGFRAAEINIDEVQLYLASGNISGHFELWGLKP